MGTPRYTTLLEMTSAFLPNALPRLVLSWVLSSAAVAAALLGGARPVSATSIQVGSAKAVPGQPAEVCVSLKDSGARVAGVQMDLGWDGGCLTADLAGGNAAACRANPATGKRVQSNLKGSNLKVFFFSITDLRPIPDGELFCCSFTLARSAPTPCCNVTISGVRGSTGKGQPITDIAATGGSICASSATGASSAQPTTAPLQSVTAGAATGPTPRARRHRAQRSTSASPHTPRKPRSPTTAAPEQTPTTSQQSGETSSGKPADH
jgi:hypothetical protein